MYPICIFHIFCSSIHMKSMRKWKSPNRFTEIAWLTKYIFLFLFYRQLFPPLLMLYSLFAWVMQKGKQASIMQQSKSQYILVWTWMRCPRLVKIMECVTLFLAFKMETALRRKYPALDSSTRLCAAGKWGRKWVQCEHLNVSRKLLPNIENYKAFCFNKIYPAISFTLHGCILVRLHLYVC